MKGPGKTTRSSVTRKSTGQNDVNSSAPTPSSTSRFADKWTDEEIEMALKAWKEHRPPISWVNIAKEVKEQDPLFTRTPASIRTKICTLQRSFTEAKKKGSKNVPYFDIFDEVEGGLVNVKAEDQSDEIVVDIESEDADEDFQKPELPNGKRKISRKSNSEDLEIVGPTKKPRETQLTETPNGNKTEKPWTPRETDVLIGCWVQMKQSPQADPGLEDVEENRDFWKDLIHSIQDRMPMFQRSEEQCQERIKQVISNYRQSKGEGRRASTTFKLLDNFFVQPAVSVDNIPEVAAKTPVEPPVTVEETGNAAKPSVAQMREAFQNCLSAVSTFAEMLFAYME